MYFYNFPKIYALLNSYFILTLLPIIPILFFCVNNNVSGRYWHLEKQELGFVADIIIIVQILVIQVNGQLKSSLPFLKLTHLSCHCLPLILIFNRYQSFIICDQAWENRSYLHKIHLFKLWHVSFVLYVLSKIC